MLATEAAGCLIVLEATHTSDPALDAAMVLFKPVVQVSTRPVPNRFAEHAADRPRVRAMTIRRHSVRTKSHGCPGRTEEGFRRLHVAVVAEHSVDQVTVPIIARYR